MKNRLLWKLLLFNIVPVIGIVILVVWAAIDNLAADYFMTLMDEYDVSPTETHRMFLASVHRYLLWAAVAALLLALFLSYLLTRRILRPLSEMVDITREIAAGQYGRRLAVTSSDEVGALGVAFNRMAEGLERVEELRKTMVGDVAHELRTPLTNLRGYLEAAIDRVVPPSPETLRLLQAEIMRLVHLVEDLQSLARADAARRFLRKEPLSLMHLARQILTLYDHPFQAKRISVETHFDPDCDTVDADPDKLLQAMRNLVDNAWRYTPPAGTLTVSSRPGPQGVTVAFANTGEGIPESDLPFVFERFFRTDRSRSRARGGAGIGLAIVKELIEAHGGTVGAESAAGLTRIWFTLPA